MKYVKIKIQGVLTMNIYSKMKQFSNFTPAEQTFINYILDHPYDIINLHIEQISKQSYVSISTIYRVIEKLGLTGINQLKWHISNHLEKFLQEKGKNTDYNYPFQEYDTHHDIIIKMLSLYDQTLMSTFNLIDLETFLKIVQEMKKAHRIILFPSVGNFFMAECFQQNMLEIGVNVEVIKQPFYQHWHTFLMEKNDLAIIISYANRTRFPELDKIIKQIKSSGAKVVLISSTYENKLKWLADYHLYFCSYEDSEEKIASFSSRISLQYLLDCLYAAYFNTDYQTYLKHRMEHYID